MSECAISTKDRQEVLRWGAEEESGVVTGEVGWAMIHEGSFGGGEGSGVGVRLEFGESDGSCEVETISHDLHCSVFGRQDVFKELQSARRSHDAVASASDGGIRTVFWHCEVRAEADEDLGKNNMMSAPRRGTDTKGRLFSRLRVSEAFVGKASWETLNCRECV